MARATVEGVIEEVAEEMACLERALPPPIGVELTPEANGMGPCSASLARMRREVEANLAEHAAAAMKLEEVMAMLGAELVGSDAYSQAWKLVPLVLAGERVYSEMVTTLERGRRRVLAARTLQAAVRFRLRRPLGPNREPYSRTVATLPGSVEMFARGAARRIRAYRGYATARTGSMTCTPSLPGADGPSSSGWRATRW